MRASIRDIAERAGVSAVTVSNVLRGNASRASEETRNKVLSIAAELQYVPVSQPMVQSRRIATHIIGLVFGELEIEGYWGGQIYRGLRQGAEEFGYDLLIVVRERHPWMERGQLGFLDRRCDGFIFVSPQGRSDTLAMLVENGIPAAACFSGEVPKGVSLHVLDNAGAIRLAMDKMYALGHRRIAFLTSPGNRTDFTERLRGYRESVRRLALPLETVIDFGSDSPNWGLAVEDALFTGGTTAFVCSNDMAALNLKEFVNQLGPRVPDEVSISGMDDIPDAARRDLTTIRFSSAEVGRGAVESIVRQLSGEPVAEKTVVPVEWILRGSVAPVRM